MKLEEIKSELINRIKQFEVCPEIHNIQIAKNYQEVLQIGVKYAKYAWQKGIVDFEMFSNFPTDELIHAGIYLQDTIIINPKNSIYIPPTVKLEVEVLEENKTEFHVGGILDLNVKDNAKVVIHSWFNSKIKITLANNSIACINTHHESELIYNGLNNSKADIHLNSYSLNHNINTKDNAHVNLHSKETNTTTYTIEDESTINFNMYEQATLINGSIL